MAQLRRDELRVLLEQPDLLSAAAWHVWRHDRRRASDEMPVVGIVGYFVRLQLPWHQNGQCALFSVARIQAVCAPSGEGCSPRLQLEVLHEDTKKLLLDDEQTDWLAPIEYVSNLPVTNAEAAAANVGELSGMRHQCRVLAHLRKTAALKNSVLALRRRPRCTAIEEHWFILRDGEADHEHDGDPRRGDSYSFPGLRSHSAWLGELLGGRNMAVSLASLITETEDSLRERCDRVFGDWPTREQSCARLLGMWLIETRPHFAPFVEYVQLLCNAPSELNFARDVGGFCEFDCPSNAQSISSREMRLTMAARVCCVAVGLHRVFTLLFTGPATERLEAGSLVAPVTALDRQCPICFVSMEGGFAGGARWVQLQPCRHWTCTTCAQMMANEGRKRCPLGCGPVRAWNVMAAGN